MFALRIAILAAAIHLIGPAAASGDDFFVVVFGAESDPKRPKYSHSWATFVRVPCQGSPEIVTISWLPTDIELHPNRLRPEPGTNFDSPTTFLIVLAQCEEVMAWGPYRVNCELFARAKQQACRLASGEVQYKTIDMTRNPKRVSNCIHALTTMNPENRRLRIGRTNFGDTASYYITDSYREWFVSCHPECWVADVLELNQYPIKWRTLEQGRPRSGD